MPYGTIDSAPTSALTGTTLGADEIVRDSTADKVYVGDGVTPFATRGAFVREGDETTGNAVLVKGNLTGEVARPLVKVMGNERVDAMRWATTGVFDQAAAQAALDNAPVGCDLYFPAGRGNGVSNQVVLTSALKMTKSMSLHFGHGLDFVLIPGSGDVDTNLFEIDIEQDLPYVGENRMVRIFGNGSRMSVHVAGGSHYSRGGYVFALGHNSCRSGWRTHTQIMVRDLALSGGTKGCALIKGPNPLDSPGTNETMFVQFYNCLFDGGVDDFSSDCSVFEDCISMGANARPGYRFRKTFGAFCSTIRGGMTTNSGGAIEVIDGDMILVENHQMEFPQTNPDPTQYLGATVRLIGEDRPINGFTLRNCNFGGGPDVGTSVAIFNAYRTVIDGCQFRPATATAGTADSTSNIGPWSMGPCDIFLGNPDGGAFGMDGQGVADVIALDDAVTYKRADAIGAYGTVVVNSRFHGDRGLQPLGSITDPTRRLVVSASTTVTNPQYGLWMPIADHPDFALGEERELGSRGCEVIINPSDGRISFSGNLTNGATTGLVMELPAWCAPHTRTARVPVVSGNAVAALEVVDNLVAVVAGGALAAGGSIDLEGLTYPGFLNYNPYKGIVG